MTNTTFQQLYPRSFAEHQSMAGRLAEALSASTGKRHRIGLNKMSALLAEVLPHAPTGFNINHLKVIDGQCSTTGVAAHPAPTLNEPRSLVDAVLEHLADSVSIWVAHTIPAIAARLKSPLTFDNLALPAGPEGGVFIDPGAYFFERRIYEISAEQASLIEQVFPQLCPDILEDAYELHQSTASDTLSYKTVRKHVAGLAYRGAVLRICHQWLADLRQWQQRSPQRLQTSTPAQLQQFLRDVYSMYSLTDALHRTPQSNMDSLAQTSERNEHPVAIPLHQVTMQVRVRLSHVDAPSYLVPMPWISSEQHADPADEHSVLLTMERYIEQYAHTPADAIDIVAASHQYDDINGASIVDRWFGVEP